MKTFDLMIALLVTCLWGINFSVIKLGVDAMDPFILTGLRFSFVALPAVFFISRPQVSFRLLASYGLIFGVGVWAMMTLSLFAGLSAGMAGMLLQFSAFISALLGVVFLREKLTVSQSIGLLLSIVGLGLIVTIEDGSVTPLGIILALVAAVSLSAVGLIIKKTQIKEMFAFVIWSSLFAPLPIFVLSLIFNGSSGFVSLVENIDFNAVFSVLFQSYLTTLLGYWAWNKLLVRYPLSLMAPISLLVPMFGLLGSVIFYQEKIGAHKLIACLVIMLGVALPFLGQLKIKIAHFANRNKTPRIRFNRN